MQKKLNPRLFRVVNRRRPRASRCRNYEQVIFAGVSSRCDRQNSINDYKYRQYSTKKFSVRESSVLLPEYSRSRTTFLRDNVHLSVDTEKTTYQFKRQQCIRRSRNLFSSIAGKGDSWNKRARDFLDRTLEFSTTDPPNANDATTIIETDCKQFVVEQLRPSEIAVTIQALLDDLLEITAAAKGLFPNNTTSDDTQTQAARDEENSNYLSWISLPSYASSSADDDYLSQTQAIDQNITDEDIDVDLTLALLDRLTALEQADNSTVMNHTLEWTSHTQCLNPILQLWKQSYSPLPFCDSNYHPTSTTTYSPSQILAKLDMYRRHSNLLIPDVQSYNIILDAVATHYNSTNRKLNKSIPLKGNSNVDIRFCQSLWEWMWKESKQDSLVRPDEITLRIMLKANVFTGHVLAPQRCEALVDEWAKYNDDSLDNFDKATEDETKLPTLDDPRGTLIQSLIHVWALHDPKIAESYLKELARRYLSGASYNPPDTISWNRVISAYSIAYSQPEKGLEILEDFWEFYRQAHGLDDTASATKTTSSESKNAADPVGINTKSNSLKLSNARAISDSTIETSSSGMDSAIWKVHQPNVQTYNSLLEGFARQGNTLEANKIFERMSNSASISPNIATFTSAIKANGYDFDKVKNLAKQCITASEMKEDRKVMSTERSGDIAVTKSMSLDHPFFHELLRACANSKNIKEAKKIIKQMKTFDLTPNATTYRILMEVFLSKGDSQGAIEWLLAYARYEGMSESAIVSCAIRLLEWYKQSPESGDVDCMVLLEILCENDYITKEKPLQELFLNLSPAQARAVLGWLRHKKNRTSLKMWAIVMRAFAQEVSDAREIEDLFHQLKEEPLWVEKFDQSNASTFNDEEEKLVVEICSSIIVAWSKQGKLNRWTKQRIQHWNNELKNYGGGSLSLNLAAQVAIVTMYCEAGDPLNCEQYVKDLYRDHGEGKINSPPDTIMCNMVLKAWAKRGNGLRAAAFFEEFIKEPDAVSYNTVVNAYSRQGQLDKAEEWACKLVDSFIENPLELRRPQLATFTVLLAGWRRSKHPAAAERAEKVLRQMHQLHNDDILLGKPDLKSYQTVLDTWEKSSRFDAAQKAEELLLSSSDYKTNKRLVKKVKSIRLRNEKKTNKLKKKNAF